MQVLFDMVSFLTVLSQNLMESLDSLLCAEGSESLKSLCLKLLLCLVTVSNSSMYFFVRGVN